MSDPLVVKQRRQIRQDFLRAVGGLTDAQLIAIPNGASNNILWNVGHVLYDQYSVLYRPCGLPDPLPAGYKKWFDCGTSPHDWTAPPSVGEVRETFRTLIETVLSDYADGKFSNFEPYELDDETPVVTIEEALAFDAIHESSHYGVAITLRRFVTAER